MIMLYILLVLPTVFSEACPPWTIYNSSSGQCQCGRNLKGMVHCDTESLKVTLFYCYCMTYDGQTNETTVGHCLAGCIYGDSPPEKVLNRQIQARDLSELNKEMCGDFNKAGQLCGQCKEGYGNPVYSISFECVKCRKSDFRYNLLKYIAVAFIPLTFFYLAAVFLKLNVTTGSMVAYILINQVFSMPNSIRMLTLRHDKPIPGSYLILTVSSIWNLDFFRSLYSPFCIHPEMSTLQVLALDYVVGVYPLVLIFLTYIAVKLYDRYVPTFATWKQAHKCTRQKWNPCDKLIQTFSTFLVLSYVKILNVSFDLLIPVNVQRLEGKPLKQLYLYNDGNIQYFEKNHLPYGILAIIMLTVFNILPIMILLIYPCRCFHKCLNFFNLHSKALHTFVDTFQGCYQHQPKDYRYFAAVYLFTRFFQLLTFAVLRDVSYYSVTGFYFIMLMAAVVITKPYKQPVHNTTNVIFLAMGAVGYFVNGTIIYTQTNEPQLFQTSIHIIVIVVICIIFLYASILCIKTTMPLTISQKLADLYRHMSCKLKRNTTEEEEIHYSPNFGHETECSPLLRVQ